MKLSDRVFLIFCTIFNWFDKEWWEERKKKKRGLIR